MSDVAVEKPIEDIQDPELDEIPEDEDPQLSEELKQAIAQRRNVILKECEKARKRLDLSSSKIDDLDTINISNYLT